MPDLKEMLYSKQHKQAHDICLQLEQQCEQSNALYTSFPLFLEMLRSPVSFVRVRGFRLICAQAKWDTNGLFEKHLSEILNALDDEKPTSVRQYLSVLPNIMRHQPQLKAKIRIKLETLDLSNFKDSMRPLIAKDIADILAGETEGTPGSDGTDREFAANKR